MTVDGVYSDHGGSRRAGAAVVGKTLPGTPGKHAQISGNF
jgi:hypothetical protein